jgi:hypothetical protein
MKRNNKIKLADLEHEQPFITPNGYFDNLEDQILLKIDQQNEPKQTKNLFFYLKPVIGIAASFALVYLLVSYPIKLINSKFVTQNHQENFSIDQELRPTAFFADRDLIESIHQMEQPNNYNDTDVETVLLASLSEIELMELNK